MIFSLIPPCRIQIQIPFYRSIKIIFISIICRIIGISLSIPSQEDLLPHCRSFRFSYLFSRKNLNLCLVCLYMESNSVVCLSKPISLQYRVGCDLYRSAGFSECRTDQPSTEFCFFRRSKIAFRKSKVITVSNLYGCHASAAAIGIKTNFVKLFPFCIQCNVAGYRLTEIIF